MAKIKDIVAKINAAWTKLPKTFLKFDARVSATAKREANSGGKTLTPQQISE